jgi:phosphopantothenoylcysteine decarboxylase/phosphopantothenate--cysteine ligase
MSKSENNSKHHANILLLMSGSIACAKATSLISEWTKMGHKVRVACTRSVVEFVGPSTLQGLGAELVFDNVFAAGQTMEHISLGRWADIVIVAPATSNLINKFSAGIADDAVTTLWQAYPATRESVAKLKQWGIHVLPVGQGHLACGEQGEGRMLESIEILQLVERLLAFDRQGKGKRILITAGGTREPIDSVRYIGNSSSGQTASSLADDLTSSGHRVTWLGARGAAQPALVDGIVQYSSFSGLESRLKELLATGEYDVVIHAAAVSDFSVAAVKTGEGRELNIDSGKLSSGSNLVLHLKRNPKLLDSLKVWSGKPGLRVIGFKLTDTQDRSERLAAVMQQLEHSGVDGVVHNDLSDISEAGHHFCFHSPGQKPVDCCNKQELAKTINQSLEAVA